MLRPLLGISEGDLERELLRKSVGALAAGRASCDDCGRTPLVGERVHLLRATARSSATCAGRGAPTCPSARRSSTTPSAGTRFGDGPPDGPRVHSRAVDPVSVEITIARPREEVFEYLADIANHAEFNDHFMVDWRLTREDTYGYGAGARFRLKMPFNRFPWGDTTVIEFERPRRISEAGRGGKFNRIRSLGVYDLDQGSAGTTRVRFTLLTEPKTLTDKFLESFGARGWMKRKLKKSMRRLRDILEEDRGRGARPSLAGGSRKPATGSPFHR